MIVWTITHTHTCCGGNVTSAGWQVTLCDPMWHVSSRSSVATLQTTIHLLLTYLLTYTHTHTHPFNGPLSGTTRVSRYQKGKAIWILLQQETVSGSGISWATCKFAPRSRQITMPAPHHSVFYRPDALPSTRPTASKH